MRCLDLEWEMRDLTLCLLFFLSVTLCFSVFSDCPLDCLAAVKEFLANVGSRGVYS